MEISPTVGIKPFGIVYKITNSVNGKSYVGQTILGLRRRWMMHCAKSRADIPKRRIHIAMKKYGIEAFTVECIGSAPDRESLNNLEEKFIEDLATTAPTGYNVMTKAMWRKWGEYKDISLSLKNRPPESMDSRQARSNRMRGRTLSIEHKRAISAATTGRKHGPRINRPKLTKEQVLSIRADIRPQRQIAMEYGLTHGVVACVRNGLTYKQYLPKVIDMTTPDILN